MVTIKYIAQMAGVSTATVSRVLNKTKYVNPEIEKRVMQVVKKYHYHPNYAARALSTSHSHTLGLIGSESINMYQSVLLPYFYHNASISGYSVINTLCKQDFQSRLKAFEMLQERHVDGIMCTFELTPEEEEEVSSRIEIPFFHVYSWMNREETYLMEEKATYEAVKYLIGLRHTRIGGLFPSIKHKGDFASGREDGFRRALTESGIPVMEQYISTDINSITDVVDHIHQIVKPDDYPTALFCYSDESAIGAMFYLAQQGIRIPDDISVIGFDGIPMGNMISPRLTTVVQPVEVQAKVMVDKLICRVEEREFILSAEEKKGWGYQFEIRESCCPFQKKDSR